MSLALGNNFPERLFIAPEILCNSMSRCYDLVERVTGTIPADLLPFIASIAAIAAAGFSSYQLFTSRELEGMPVSCMLIGVAYILTGLALRIPTLNLRKRDQMIIDSQKNEKTVLLIDSSELAKEEYRTSLSIFRQIAKTYKIERREIKDKQGVQDLVREEEKYDILCFRAHGNPDGIWLGEYFLSKEYKNFIGQLSKKVQNGAKIIFASCNAGEGENNIARAFSSFNEKSTVYAGKRILSAFWGFRINDEGVPKFRDLLGFDMTRIYEKGKIVEKNDN